MQDREQRVAVIGSSHFLANNYLGYGKNLDFGINLVNWLAGDENLISIPPRATPDSSLILSERAQIAIVVGFLIILPLSSSPAVPSYGGGAEEDEPEDEAPIFPLLLYELQA